MKIAQLAPPWLPIPPKGYGGTETIVHLLTEELVKRGHDVTLFATGDSKTSAKLSYVFPKALGNSGELKGKALYPMLHFENCFKRANEFDIIHNHAQYLAMFLADVVKTPVVHTIHGSFAPEYTPKDKIATLKRFKNHNFISISNSQRKDFAKLNYVATVYNGIDTTLFEFSPKKGEYLLWIGRITPKKGVVDAIKAAKRLKRRLKIAAAIDPIDREYFEKSVRPLIDGKLISYEGEVNSSEKIKLYQGALCTLYPIHWNEPFGLVMAESMSCGTPIIAYNRGSVPELVVNGLTGFVVPERDGVDGLIGSISKLQNIKRENCRKQIETNFTYQKMAGGYEKVYQKICKNITRG